MSVPEEDTKFESIFWWSMIGLVAGALVYALVLMPFFIQN
jgi:hypothetical protein